jgi:hypothetical protein
LCSLYVANFKMFHVLKNNPVYFSTMKSVPLFVLEIS